MAKIQRTISTVLPAYQRDRNPWRRQILNLVLTMDARLLYDSPYSDFSPRAVDGVFESKEVDELVSILKDVRKRAVG